MKIFIIIIVVGILCWIAWSYFSSNVEQLKYTVVEKKEKYEIRKYEKYIEAKVEVDGLGRQALGDGFRILANYIFGGNLGNKQVAMTAPVLVGQKLDGEKVAMTAPVLAKEEGGKTEVVFSMPSKYSPLPSTCATAVMSSMRKFFFASSVSDRTGTSW